jgi:hypothetical protein
MRIPNKFNGYSADNRRLYNMGGGPATSYSNTSNIPPYAKEYVQRMLGATEKEIYTGTTDAEGKFTATGFRPYKPFQGETVAGFSPMQTQAMRGIQNFQLPGQTGDASNLAGYAGLGSMMAGQNYASQATNPYATQAYMSPYIQGALAPQMEEARRQANITRQQTAGEAVKSGAFGGSRFGIREAEENRNLGKLQDQIYGTGMQNAFQAAQQAQQFGANLGLQGYGQAGQQAALLGQLGQQQYGQEMGLLGQQAAVGKQQQDYEQARLNQIIQDYATQQQYPFIQLGTLSNMLRGLPMQASTTQMYQAQPSFASQAAGAVGTGLGLVQQYNKAFPSGPGQKEGGVVSMASGGIATGVSAGKLASALKGPQFDDKALQQKVGDPDTDQATKDLVAAEQARRAGLRAGMATGGIVAFKKGSKKSVKEDTEQKAEDITLPEADVGGEGIRKALNIPDAPKEAEPSSAERIKAIGQSYAGGQPQPKAEALSQQLPDPGYMADNVPAAARSTPPANAGITAPNNPMLRNVNQLYSDVEAANLEAGRDMQGNKIGAEADPADAAIEEHIGSLKRQQSPLQEIMGKSKADLIKSYKKEREEMELPDPANRERELLEARKTRGEQSEQETARNNLIRFLTKWGTIPGSTMRGLIGAGSDLIDKMDIDEKHRQKFLNEMDDIESRINNAEYSRRLGDEDRARKEKDEAGKLYYKLASDITEIRLKEALKDKDVRKAIAVEEAKIKREEAKGPKGEEYMVKVYSKALTAANPNKYPAGPVTDGIAAQMYMRDKPGVLAAGMNLPYHETVAGASSSQAATAATKAITDAGTAKGAQATQFEKDLRAKIAIGDVATEISRANKEDPKGEKGLVKAIKERERKALLNSGNYPLLTVPAAPAKPAEPKKEEGKPKAAAPSAKPDISNVKKAPAGSSVGDYVQGKGWGVKDKNGKLIGYIKE